MTVGEEVASTSERQHDPLQQFLRNQPTFLKELLAGGLAGGIAKTAIAPLERTKILFQTGRTPKGGVLGTLAYIWNTEGWAGLFRGNSASVLRIVPYAAIHFSAYEWYRRALSSHVLQPTTAHHDPAAAPATSSSSSRHGASQAASHPGGSVHGHEPEPSRSRSSNTGSETLREHNNHADISMSQQVEHDSPAEASALAVGVTADLPSALASLQQECPLEEATGAAVGASQDSHDRHAWQQQQQQQQQAAQRQAATPASAAEAMPAAAGHAAQHLHPVWDLLAGSAAGATAVLLTYPLDLVRTRLAVASETAGHSKHQHQHQHQLGSRLGSSAAAAAGTVPGQPQRQRQAHSIRSLLVQIGSQEGVQGLYRGVWPTLLGILPYAGLKFYCYQSLKMLHRQQQQQQAPGTQQAAGGKLPITLSLLFGGVSGLVAQTVTYPLDIVRRRMQVAGLTGTLPVLPAQLPAGAMAPAQHLAMAGAAAAGGGLQGPVRITPAASFATDRSHAAGGVAAGSSAGASGRGPAEGMWRTLVRVVREGGGLHSLFRGLSINYVKVVPSTAIGFTVYDHIKTYLGVHNSL